MKNLTLWKTEQDVEFNLQNISTLVHTPLTDLQSEKIGFVELCEGCLVEDNVQGYTIFKLRQSKRKPLKPATVEREFNSRMKKLSKQEVSFNMDTLLEEVNQDLTRMSDINDKDVLVVYDEANQRFMLDCPRNAAEDVISFLRKVCQEGLEFSLVKSDPSVMQNLMTKWVMKESSMPEPFVLGEYTELAAPALVGGSSKTSQVIVKKEHSSCQEVKKHLEFNKRVNKLELDSDGVIFFKIDSTFYISSLAFEESLKYTEDKELTEEENLLAHWNVVLPELSTNINTLLGELEKEEESDEFS